MTKRDRKAARAVLLALATFVFCAVEGWGIWKFSALRRFDLDIATAKPAPPDHYLAHDRGGHVDHHVLFHGLDEASLQHLRRADVLLMGNSRLMFALRGDALRRYFTARGLRPFALGFGHQEQHRFPQEVMTRHGLRPKVVLANVDNFFGGVTSPWGERVLADTAFDARKAEFEANASHVVRRVLHRVVPHVPDLVDGEREFVIYRAERDGSWFIATEFGASARLRGFYSGRDVVRPHNLALARAFKESVEAAGARLVFVLVPGPDVSLTHARQLADMTGVPLVAPEVEGLRTMDGSHLTDESAERYASVFFRYLDPVLDEVLRLP
ncbi:hypothetical protein [Luteitalea sp. TBR-22]|uniref:hypothetical protein n=1 Tax=Luteitalea sp. TBR-22 TaxID=2802971 RepID=UPI001EF4188B|nr:hypothetical protein [Luteitalea sp. TBR-22]